MQKDLLVHVALEKALHVPSQAGPTGLGDQPKVGPEQGPLVRHHRGAGRAELKGTK